MKKLLLSLLFSFLALTSGSAFAGDCITRNPVNWHATITSAVFLRSACPTGDIVGTIPGGEVVEILEVDGYNEFYLIKSSVGTGFVFNSFLKDIKKYPLPGTETYPDSVFIDLNPSHKYYNQIADLKAKGIINGTPEGKVFADNPVNRAELAKILVEATTDDATISEASLEPYTYSDVTYGAWYDRYLYVANVKGIMTGDGKVTGPLGTTTVRPGDNANGAEVAKMVSVAFNLQVAEPANGEQWFDPYMNAVKALNAMPYSDPSHVVTRGEMMFMVSTILAK